MKDFKAAIKHVQADLASGEKMDKLKKDEPAKTKEQQLAANIINALNEWMRIGARENFGFNAFFIEKHFREIAPEKYHPNKYLEFRKSIGNLLWMDSIFLTLKANAKDGLAADIEQRQSEFLIKIDNIDKNLEPTNAMHLPNRQLIYLAARLRNALEKALPCLTTQPASGSEVGKTNKKVFFRWYLEGFALCILSPICIKRLTGMSFTYMLGIFLLELIVGLFVYFFPQIAKIKLHK